MAGGKPAAPLFKQKSWSPDSDREEAWERRKGLYKTRRRRQGLSRSVTEEDLEELKGCIDLGFGFGFGSPDSTVTASSSDDLDRLSDTLPALDLFNAVISPGDSPQEVKRRLKQWAQVVACTLRSSLRRPLQQELKEEAGKP